MNRRWQSVHMAFACNGFVVQDSFQMPYFLIRSFVQSFWVSGYFRTDVENIAEYKAFMWFMQNLCALRRRERARAYMCVCLHSVHWREFIWQRVYNIAKVAMVGICHMHPQPYQHTYVRSYVCHHHWLSFVHLTLFQTPSLPPHRSLLNHNQSRRENSRQYRTSYL